MLKTLRKNTKIVVWSVVVSFALWGGYSVSSQMRKESMYAGKIFGKNISFQEFGQFHRSAQLFTFGEKRAEDEQVLRQTAWQGLIFSREARRRKIEVPDEEVRKEVLQLLEKQKVDPQNYPMWLERGIHETPKEFESQVREVLRIQKLVEKLRGSLPNTAVTDAEAHDQYFKDGNQLSLSMISFPTQKEAAAFRKKIKKPGDWDKETKAKQGAAGQIGPLPVTTLASLLQITPQDAEKLHKLEKDAVSEPVPSGKKFTIFRILNKKTAEEKQFAVDKENLIKNLKDQKIQKGLLEKTQGIITKADLKDYQTNREPS